ncbi:NAD(P)H-dependent glycerol-3-phosphate dehydrogenase [Oryzibacter oryziterrae]|uniref:NAD(P)H-dependent glycerol-3-phosphate dehydrogenase n=1 Tax=Oryzibacter oryziterrae TaxID=2766474 RepID=UPI001F3599F1|nr:NAD(P)H-dependent glycerol-3-phosphate dehydrogenase [Oryzibacter oryziterrae]
MTQDQSQGMDDRPAVIGVLGAGAWGSALALTSARAGHRVLLVGRNGEVIEAINRTRRSPVLPMAQFPDTVLASTDVAALRAADVLLLAVPAQATRAAVADIADVLRPGTVVVTCAKGIERESGFLLTEVISYGFQSGPVAVLSGPGFAEDLARGLPTAVTIAADDIALAEVLAYLLAGPGFRPYAASDMVGVQLGGAIKNVLAIAAGVVIGRGLGASAQAAVITRGFVEMRRLAAAFGAKSETLMGLSGLGDLMLTCGSGQSRNYAFGMSIGQGVDPASFGKLAEGAATAEIAVTRARSFGIEVPIMSAVADVLSGRIDVNGAIERLMSRPLKREDAS